MKYFNIEAKAGDIYSWDKLETASGFQKILNCEEKLRVLEEQLRPCGLQPILSFCGTCIEIIPASKKFLNRERRYNQVISKRAQEYMRFCDKF